MKSAGMASSAGVRKQGVNPFLPLDKYIPDGEPHVFGGRVCRVSGVPQRERQRRRV